MAVSKDQKEYKITSQFAICTKEVLLKSNNLYLAKFLPDFKRFGYLDHIVSEANNVMLNLISIYDEKNEKEFLDVAKGFSNWLYKCPDDLLDYYIKEINHLQIIKRYRIFKKPEKEKLLKIIEKEESPMQYKVAAYALLGNQEEAEYFFKKLSKEQKDLFANQPIERFLEFRHSELKK